MKQEAKNSPKRPRNRMHGHKKKGGRLITPMNQLPSVEELSWKERVLPEVLWIGFAVNEERGGYESVAREIRDLTCWVEKEYEGLAENPPCVVFATEWPRVEEGVRKAAREQVREGRWPLLSRGAELARGTVGERGTDCLAKDSLTDGGERAGESRTKLAEVVLEGGLRDSRLAIFLRGTLLLWQLEARRIQFVEGVAPRPDEWEAAIRDPTSEKGAAGASWIRAHLHGCFTMFAKNPDGPEWAAKFWRTSRERTPCIYAGDETPNRWDENTWEKFVAMAQETERMTGGGLKFVRELLGAGKPHEAWDYRTVAEGIVARAASLFQSMGINPRTWTATTAPLVLRPMIECYIDLAYIAKDPGTRAGKYLDAGMGREKIAVHQAEVVARRQEDEAVKQLLQDRAEIGERIVESRKAEWATDGQQGDWAGNDLRKRAKEADLEDLYEGAYSPWSNVMHNSWSHLVRTNSEPCLNPLHLPHARGVVKFFWEE